MDKETLWQLAYVSVLAIRMHPRNDSDDVYGDVEEAALSARVCAERALDDFGERFAPVVT